MELDCDDGDDCTADFCAEPDGCDHHFINNDVCADEVPEDQDPSTLDAGCGCSQRPGQVAWTLLLVPLALWFRRRETPGLDL